MREPDLFYAFKSNYLPNLKVAVGSYSVFDAIDHTAKVVVEFKCLRKHYNDVLLEWPKYANLLNRAADKGYKPIFICSTPRGVWAWDLTYLTLNWITKDLPATTEREDKRIVKKQVAFVSVLDGSKLTKIK